MKQNSSSFTTDLLAWYRANKRNLPWRERSDLYGVWVSEAMLQQTRVETVIPYYQSFLKIFPTMRDLAEAPEEKVLKAWEGLGYYRRARLLQSGVREVVALYGGEVPADPAVLAGLPGVGPYMAGALASIVYNLPVPAVDGNVLRVASRILAWEESIESPRSKKKVQQWVAERFPTEAAGDFTQALMELGALICLPRKPRCPECPVSVYCKGLKAGPEKFPIRKVETAIPSEERLVLIITWNGKRLLQKRPQTGLMAGFWEYPHEIIVREPQLQACAWAKELLGMEMDFHFCSKMGHTYSHLHWELHVFQGEWKLAKPPRTLPNSGWFTPEEEAALPRVAFVRKLAKKA
jgi:A/G-specific adenine glycosylase